MRLKNILDVQLGGACNLKCIYCDTPKYHLPCSLDIDSLEQIIKNDNIEWVYTCGLGEPTAPGNIETFKKILNICKKNKAKVSVFSNIVNLDDELLGYIEGGTLNAMHITNTNNVIVDEKTGLSCAWFWLENPKMIRLGNIKEMSANEITKKIIDYRKSKFKEVIDIEKTLKSHPFGGCGGDAKTLLNQYISIAKY